MPGGSGEFRLMAVSVPFYSGKPFRRHHLVSRAAKLQCFSPLLFGEAFSASRPRTGGRAATSVSVPFYSGKPFRRCQRSQRRGRRLVSVPFYSGKPFRRPTGAQASVTYSVSVPFYSGKPFRLQQAVRYGRISLTFQSPSIRGSLFGVEQALAKKWQGSFSPLLFGEAFSAHRRAGSCCRFPWVSVPFYSGKPFRPIPNQDPETGIC